MSESKEWFTPDRLLRKWDPNDTDELGDKIEETALQLYEEYFIQFGQRSPRTRGCGFHQSNGKLIKLVLDQSRKKRYKISTRGWEKDTIIWHAYWMTIQSYIHK